MRPSPSADVCASLRSKLLGFGLDREVRANAANKGVEMALGDWPWMTAVKNARHGRMCVLYAGDGAGTGRVACLESAGGECWTVDGQASASHFGDERHKMRPDDRE